MKQTDLRGFLSTGATHSESGEMMDLHQEYLKNLKKGGPDF
jgi:hypothetical protein